MGKLQDFANENFNWPKWDNLADGEMVTEMVIMYRVVNTSKPMDDGYVERVDYKSSIGCSYFMGRGIMLCIEEDLATQDAIDAALDDEDDSDGST
jgi:hypothetical protein